MRQRELIDYCTDSDNGCDVCPYDAECDVYINMYGTTPACEKYDNPERYTDKELPIVQPEPQEGHWIKHESPDGGEQYECSECGVLWEFNDGTPEDNEAYFCPKCGTKMKGERQK